MGRDNGEGNDIDGRVQNSSRECQLTGDASGGIPLYSGEQESATQGGPTARQSDVLAKGLALHIAILLERLKGARFETTVLPPKSPNGGWRRYGHIGLLLADWWRATLRQVAKACLDAPLLKI
jgi:hypothetical protein